MIIFKIILYIFLILIFVLGIFLLAKYMTRTRNTYAVSLDSPIHIDPNTLQPVIPRHVRDELREARLAQQATPALIEHIDESEMVIEPKISDVEPYAHTSSISTKEEPILKLNPNIEVKQVEAFKGESELLTVNLEEQQRQDERYAPAEQQQVIEFYVYIDDSEDTLTGERFLKILDRYGLRFGEMNYFHRYQEDEQGQLHHMFSLGKRTFEGQTEPFDLNMLPNDKIYGIVFFLTLPHYDAVTGYDMMMTSMHRMARELNGHIFDSNRNQLTTQLEEDLREAIKSFVEQED